MSQTVSTLLKAYSTNIIAFDGLYTLLKFLSIGTGLSFSGVPRLSLFYFSQHLSNWSPHLQGYIQEMLWTSTLLFFHDLEYFAICYLPLISLSWQVQTISLATKRLPCTSITHMMYSTNLLVFDSRCTCIVITILGSWLQHIWLSCVPWVHKVIHYTITYVSLHLIKGSDLNYCICQYQFREY